MLLELLKGIFRVELVALPCSFSASPSRPLQRVGFAYWDNSEHVEHAVVVESAHLNEAAVDDIPDSRDSDAGFCDVGGEDDSPELMPGLALEDVVLVFMRECGVEHEDLKLPDVEVSFGFLETLLQAHDFVFTCEKDQDVPRGICEVDLHDGVEDGFVVAFHGFQQVVHLGLV